MDEVSEPIPEEELREFLEVDLTGVRADPAFECRLRGRLWDLVQSKARSRRDVAANASAATRNAQGPSR